MKRIIFQAPIASYQGKLPMDEESLTANLLGLKACKRADVNNAGEKVAFLSKIAKRGTAYSTTEIAQQTKFGAICKLANLRAMDESKTTADNAAFKAQSTYKTIKAYRWHKAETEFNALAGGGTSSGN